LDARNFRWQASSSIGQNIFSTSSCGRYKSIDKATTLSFSDWRFKLIRQQRATHNRCNKNGKFGDH